MSLASDFLIFSSMLQCIGSADRLWQAGALKQKEDVSRRQTQYLDQVGWNRDFIDKAVPIQHEMLCRGGFFVTI